MATEKKKRPARARKKDKDVATTPPPAHLSPGGHGAGTGLTGEGKGVAPEADDLAAAPASTIDDEQIDQSPDGVEERRESQSGPGAPGVPVVDRPGRDRGEGETPIGDEEVDEDEALRVNR